MSSQWGRIDEDGTVFVRTSSGERVIGSWQAGDAEAGLAYYTRRYDDLATEVTLLEQRLASGRGSATTRAHATELAETLPTASVIGDLGQPCRAVIRAAARGAGRLRRRWPSASKRRAAAIDAKETLIAEAEQIAAASTSWKVSEAPRHRRRVEDDSRHRPPYGRRAVEAIRSRPRRLQQAPGPTLRAIGRRARYGARRQGEARGTRRRALVVLRLEGNRGGHAT